MAKVGIPETGTPLAGPGALEAPLNASERACLRDLGLGHLMAMPDSEFAAAGVSKPMFLRIVINISEGEFTRLVMAMARAADVLAHHCGRARTCEGPGFPDLVLCGSRRVLFAELKRSYDDASKSAGWGVPSAEQAAWGERLRSASAYALWTPADLLTIGRQLRELGGQADAARECE